MLDIFAVTTGRILTLRIGSVETFQPTRFFDESRCHILSRRLTLSTNDSSVEAIWITPEEAARLRGVSCREVDGLIGEGRLRTREIGGSVLVSRVDVEGLGRAPSRQPESRPGEAGRFLSELGELSPQHRQAFFERLRSRYPDHPIAAAMGISTEVILGALDRSGPKIERRLCRVLPQSAFNVKVVRHLEGWRSLPTPKDPPYDFLLDDGAGPIRVQVKLQRSRADGPLMTTARGRSFAPGLYLVETQKTRAGKNKEGEETRPYRFGEFDILAVAMQVSAGDWGHFLYTVGDWLIPRPDDARLLLKFQPVPPGPNEDWTEDFRECVGRLRSGVKKTIGGLIGPPNEADRGP